MGAEEVNALLEAISRAQTHFLENDEPERLFDQLLTDFLSLTGSEYGMVAEVLYSEEGSPYLRAHAITDISWDEVSRRFYESAAPDGLTFYNLDNLFGAVAVSGETVIANDPASDPRSGGIPEGHPPLKAFLGLPVRAGEVLVGMVGLANRKGGYDEALAEKLVPLLNAYGRILALMRSNIKRDELQTRLTAIVETAVDAIVVINEAGVISSANPATLRMFGYSEAQLIGQNVKKLMPPEYAGRHDDYLKNYIQGGGAKIIGAGREIEGRREDGEIFPMHLSVSEFNVGKRRYFTGIIRDLSTVQQIEKDLSRFKMTLDQVKDCVFIFDAETLCFSYANQGAMQQVGYSEAELLAMKPFDIKPEYDEDSFRETIKPLLVGERDAITFITNHRHKDGHTLPVEILLQYVTADSGSRARFVAIVRDITERRAAEQALRDSDERLRRSQVFANIGTWDWNIETDELFWSERIAPLFGYAEGRLETNYENFLNAVHPEDRAMVLAAVRNCVENGAEYNIEHRCVWPDGSVRWMLERGDVVRDENGKALRMLGVVQDITDLATARSRMQEAKEEAERASRAKSEFLSSMSHELRTPLNAIMGFAQLYQFDQQATEEHKENAEEIYSAGMHLRRLIDDVLDLARIEAGHTDISSEPVGLCEIVDECLALVNPLADKRGISVSLDLGDDIDICVQADRTRLKQVLINLLSNAVKYNRDFGSVTLRCDSPEQGVIRVSVIDSGVGIAAKNLKTIFTPFSRIQSNVSEIEGTGIGLSITQQFVELMGGKIGVESKVGRGSTFWVELPISEESVAVAGEIEAQTEGEARVENERRVLVVEDNPTNRKVMQLQLQALGVRADMANDGREAVGILASQRYDLVLTDVHMPEMNGYEFVAQLRRMEAGKSWRTPVIAVTANAMEGERERCLAAGMDDYISKPVDIRLLEQTLKESFKTDKQLLAGQADTDEMSVDVSMLRNILGDDISRHCSVINTFVDNIPESIHSIREACDKENSGMVEFAAHRLKSAARSIGAFPLAELCLALEKAGRASDWQKIALLEGGIDAEISNVAGYLREYVLRGEVAEQKAGRCRSVGRALVVDDDPVALQVLTTALEELGVEHITTASDGEPALALFDHPDELPEVIFCDLNMPQMDGIEFLRHLADRNYSGAIILLSGEGGRVLGAAHTLAQAHDLDFVKAVEKPIRRHQLQELLEGVVGKRESKKRRKLSGVTEEELKRAIECDEFELHYQPKVNAEDRRLVGVEALLRWAHPARQFVMPEEFIPLAEESGLIDDLTDVVLDKSLSQLSRWRKQGFDFKLSVNIAVGTIGRHLDFPERLIGRLEKYGLEAQDLIIEVTESGVLKDISTTLDTLVRLHLKGIMLSIDDFGTGYSTFKQLQTIPFAELKIDKDFVVSALNEPASRAILESSIILGRKLDMTLVAEGVESRDEWDLIASMGCHMIQGYFVSRPLPGQELLEWLGEWNRQLEEAC